MKKGAIGSDWIFGLAFVAVFSAMAFLVFDDGFQGLERAAYDSAIRASDRSPSERVAIIAIDDPSIENIGRWPWPRDVHAAMIEILTSGGAKVIGNTILYSEAQIDPGLEYLSDIIDYFSNSSLGADVPTEVDVLQALIAEADGISKYGADGQKLQQLSDLLRDSAISQRLVPDLGNLAGKLVEAQAALDVDQTLAASFSSAKNVVQSMTFVLGAPQGKPDQPLPDYVSRHALIGAMETDNTDGNLPIPTLAALVPIPDIGRASDAIGHLSATLDVDGAQRFDPLVLRHYDEYYPSMALILAARALNLEAADILVRLGEGVSLGGLNIETTPNLLMYNYFYGDDETAAFAEDSYFDVLVGNIPAEKYKDKIVLIGASATGVGDSFKTPVSSAMAPVQTLAHTVSSILEEDFFIRPAWAGIVEGFIYVFIALYLLFVLPRIRAGRATLLTVLMLISLIVTHYYMMISEAMWLKLMVPATLLVVGHLVMTIKKFRLTETLKLSTDAESAESNKMLGLAFQGQGQLDMAFEKFRRCPPDERLLDLLYNLASDYERKRQFNKAVSVYEYIHKHNSDYRDVPMKLNRAKKLEETVILGGGGGGSGSAGATLIMGGDGDVEKPMLGRYEVDKELGKGAMGIVYLGKDPKINRTVAIKTMALSEEFEEEELENVKARFFREAETAGRLTHPNIVTIFDAGEEHDLAYIAMEYVKGGDLTDFIKPDRLLEIPKVLKIISDAADALDYAHGNSVVHRDIKPANMMYIPDKIHVKLMDFGIARLTDSSRTKTGMVLGTPSYMSPEQLSGKKVDGRSDLFSLGVTLYQLLTGQLPFEADSMATLMYRIANEAHVPIHTIRPEISAELEAVIDRAMQKDPDDRYPNGAEMARDLRTLLQTYSS